MTEAARNTIEESGEDGKLKLDDCNVAMELCANVLGTRMRQSGGITRNFRRIVHFLIQA